VSPTAENKLDFKIRKKEAKTNQRSAAKFRRIIDVNSLLDDNDGEDRISRRHLNTQTDI